MQKYKGLLSGAILALGSVNRSEVVATSVVCGGGNWVLQSIVRVRSIDLDLLRLALDIDRVELLSRVNSSTIKRRGELFSLELCFIFADFVFLCTFAPPYHIIHQSTGAKTKKLKN